MSRAAIIAPNTSETDDYIQVIKSRQQSVDITANATSDVTTFQVQPRRSSKQQPDQLKPQLEIIKTQSEAQMTHLATQVEIESEGNTVSPHHTQALQSPKWTERVVAGFRPTSLKKTLSGEEAQKIQAQKSIAQTSVENTDGQALRASSSFSNIAVFETLQANAKQQQHTTFMQRMLNGPGSRIKSASLNNINLSKPAPSKSILKKQSVIVTTPEESGNAQDEIDIAEINNVLKEQLSVENSVEYINEDGKKGYVPMAFAHRLMENAQHSSSPDLRRHVLRPLQNSQSSSMGKSGSIKSLQFDMDNVKVIETYSKMSYNRKTGNDITFKRLTPVLKEEIRSELNEYKRTEMSVHELSASHTVFH